MSIYLATFVVVNGGEVVVLHPIYHHNHIFFYDNSVIAKLKGKQVLRQKMYLFICTQILHTTRQLGRTMGDTYKEMEKWIIW